MTVVIHHNPDCSNSRNTLALIVAAGYAPVVVKYLETGWTRPQLLSLLAVADLTPRQVLRIRRTPAENLGLTADGVSDDTILDAMVANPVLVERPIVATPRGVRLCRPCESVLDILDTWPPGPFAKENGEVIIDADGNKVM
ncbi:arsenate reductase (glutaredoxin) [Rhodobacterales bacterium HKCCE2091]|nr:arsenate reductase (glutaredoxin) [Rhodobacterales bacterium HKCCE2091]